MITRWRFVLATIGAASLMVVACGDDDDEGTGGGVTATGTTQTGSGGSGGTTQTGTTGGGGSAAMTCEEACTALFDCGLEECGGLEESMRTVFTDGCPPDAPGCLDTCASLPALLMLINPDDCSTTITQVSGANPTFADRCENGIAACGSGGGGGGG